MHLARNELKFYFHNIGNIPVPPSFYHYRGTTTVFCHYHGSAIEISPFTAIPQLWYYNALWKAMRGIGVPSVLMDLIIDLHTATSARVRLAGRLSIPFTTTSGVRQGCVLAPATCTVLPSNEFHHGARQSQSRHPSRPTYVHGHRLR